MKFTLRIPFLLTILLLLNNVSFAQKYTVDHFYIIDSIANEGKPKDALVLIEKINTQARTEGNSALLIKSVIYRMMFQSYLEENAFDKILVDLRKDISLAKQPEKSILQSLLAETYWNFYQQNQWKIAQRSNVQGNIGDNINTWSIPKLIEEITKNYLSSLTEVELLQKSKLDILAAVLTGDKANRSFRPTLYDLLAHRAIDIFSNTQINLTQEQNENLDFNQPIWFADRQTFLNTKLPQTDSTSFDVTVLQLFKALIQFHTLNKNEAALADIDLKRLKFIALRNSDKELYFNALQSLANKSTVTTVYSDVLYELALMHQKSALQIDTNKLNLIKAVEIANAAIKAYPESIGGKNAKNLIKQINAKELTTQTKAYLLPNQPAQIHFSYTNVDTIYLKLFKRSFFEEKFDKITKKEDFLAYLQKNKALKEWFVVVPKSNDYRNHTLVDQIDALKTGNYLLISQNTKADQTETVYTNSSFVVTNLNVYNRLIADRIRSFIVTNANDGAPLKGVTIQQNQINYNGKANTKSGITLKTDDLGFATNIENTSSSYRTIISYQADTVAVNLNTYNPYRNYNNDDDEDKKVILFTDRPIYRPGQTAYYKGLLLAKGKDKNRILVNEKLEVSFEDPNGKNIETKELTTNEFGTFQGSFNIPMGKLNGQMEIVTDYGAINIQVEEYKRPTFEIVFNQPNQRYKLNDSIKVKAKSTAFSGYTIANAKVSYKVYRSAMYDYSLNYNVRTALYGRQVFERTQVAIGKTTTKNDGKFEFSFFAKAPSDKINYSFTIETEVTDINGETRTKSTTLNVGKKDIKLAISTAQILFASSKTDSIPFTVTNLNGEPIKANVKAEWSLLKAPSRLMNKSPFYAENYTLSKEDWLKHFPNEDYNNELEVEKWPVKNIQYHQNLTVSKGTGNLAYNTKNLTPGYYKIKLAASNNDQDTVSMVKYLIISSAEAKVIESAIEMVVPEISTISPAESAVFRVAGLTNNTKGFYEVYYKDKMVERVWLNLSPKQTIVKIKPKIDFEGSFAVQFTIVSKGTVYNDLQHVQIIDKSKQLDIKFLSFRDKLQPGEKESWKLQISNKNGEKQMAEMVATLYDASLDDLKQMDWSRNLHPTFDYRAYTWHYQINEIANSGSFWFLRRDTYYPLNLRTYEQLNLFGYNYYGGYNYSYQNYIRKIQAKPKKGLAPEAVKKLAELAKGNILYGVIYDHQGYPLPGANIISRKLKTTSNYFGVYTIDAKIGDELTIACIGYKRAKIKVEQKKRLDISLVPDDNALQEVMVTGYGSAQKKSMTAASSSVVTSNAPLAIRGIQGAVEVKNESSDSIYGSKSPDNVTIEDLKKSDLGMNSKKADIIPRTNFSETAFFYPQLKTDENGEIKIEFTIPQSLTRYKMLGFAHTKDLKTTSISNELVTQKQLAISANAPRFFREGDTIIFTAKLNNLSGKKLKGSADLELRDALTGKVIFLLKSKNELKQDFEIANAANEILKWPLIIPAGLSAITYKVVAQSGKFSDGEEMTIPVLPNAMLVTESMPINVRGNTSKTFTMEKLIKSGSSKTLRNQALTFEFTSNPIWYAVQALPYLMEYPYECAEQTFSRFYANSFATGIVNSSPKIKEIFKQWQESNNGQALLSNLEKNPELKSILLEETPWVRNAENETERKKRLAALFDLNRMTYELKDNFEKLEKMQYANGSFPWFTGMEGNRYITQHIVLGIGQLKKLKLIDDKAYPNLNIMLNKAIIYLDNELVKDYKDEIKGKHFGYMPLHYLFARSYTNQKNSNLDFVKAKEFYLKKITENWKIMDSYQLGQTALVLHRNGNKVEPAKIITLLKQTAQQSDEMGMYWAKNTNGWYWYQSPIETQSLLIEAFDEIASDSKAIEEMKIWLLKNKQTNDWKTTKATTAACYALLMKGYDLLSESADPEILIGKQAIANLGLASAPKEAGTGYQKFTIVGTNVKPEMGNVEVKNNNKTIAWGALYWQYFENLDKITPANTGVKIKKQLFIQNSTTKGNILTPLTSTNVLTPGDLLKVRIEIYCDRDMEYVHLKDMRSSGFEPVNVISSYKYQDGLGYYESTKDASTNFFISYLRKGTYVFEYALRVTHGGNFSNGITSLQCMYAPEFTSHSEGIRVNVK